MSAAYTHSADWEIFPANWRPEECVLGVLHRREVRMVGMLMEKTGVGLVFFHAHTKTQRHEKLRVAAPIDTAVLDVLAQHGIAWIYDYEEENEKGKRPEFGTLRKATVATVLAWQNTFDADDRIRAGLPDEQWDDTRRVDRRRMKARTGQLYTVYEEGPGRPLLTVPWLTGPHYEIRPLSLF